MNVSKDGGNSWTKLYNDNIMYDGSLIDGVQSLFISSKNNLKTSEW